MFNFFLKLSYPSLSRQNQKPVINSIYIHLKFSSRIEQIKSTLAYDIRIQLLKKKKAPSPEIDDDRRVAGELISSENLKI